MNSEVPAFHTYTFDNRPSGKTLAIDLMARELMPPSFSTRKLIENMPIAPGETVLDLGAGPGIVGIAARLLGAGAVTFADIVDDARQTTQLNVTHNLAAAPAGATAPFDYVTGDLYAPLGRHRFDHIIANPPSIPSPGETLPLPYRSGTDGRALHDPIQRLARYYLKAGGRLTLVHGSLANLDRSLAQLAELGFTVSLAGPFENPFAEFFPRAHIEALAAAGQASYVVRAGVHYENRYVITATRADAYATPLMRRLDAAGITFRMLPHKRVAKTVALATAERRVAVGEMIKCILLRDKARRFVLAALPGDAELDAQSVRAYVDGYTRLSFASPQEIAEVTGYPLGSVAPLPLGDPIPVVVDDAVRALAGAQRQVNISSGDPLLGLELAATDLIALLGEGARFGAIGRPAGQDGGD